jgi:hypothetical protein
MLSQKQWEQAIGYMLIVFLIVGIGYGLKWTIVYFMDVEGVRYELEQAQEENKKLKDELATTDRDLKLAQEENKKLEKAQEKPDPPPAPPPGTSSGGDTAIRVGGGGDDDFNVPGWLCPTRFC